MRTKNSIRLLLALIVAPLQTVHAAAGQPANTATEEVISLSPFEVTSSAKGYYAPNTLSGTRFNSQIGDLGASISVLTKEQMTDFAMLDLNDMFLYMANAEGTGTYTDYTINSSGDVTEAVSLNPTQANRVRGISPVNISMDNFETMGRTPVDSLNIDALELSRGPNSSISGLGNASGTANMVAASANLSLNRAQVVFRADSYGGYRESLDVNRVLLKNKLAMRFSQAFQHDGYVRKPSGTNTVRYNGMVKYRPFKNTTLSASYSFYRMNGNRPNVVPPRDNISYWIANGRPTWDPVTQVIHVNGQTIGPITADAGLPNYFYRSSIANRNIAYVGPSGMELYTRPTTTSSIDPGINSGTVRSVETSAAPGVTSGQAIFAAQPLFTTTPSVRSKEMYDWSSINVLAVNRVMDRTLTTRVHLDQILVNTRRHALALQAAFFREDTQRYAHNIQTVLAGGQLLIDPNERLIDGSPNPFFLRPYFGINQDSAQWQPARWDTTRAQLGYKLDLTHEKNWLQWLGVHQFSGYDEYKYRVSRRYSYRAGISSDHPWIPAGVSRVNQSAVAGGPAAAPVNTRGGYLRYYLGDNVGANIDYAPASIDYGVVPFLYGNSTTGFVREPVTFSEIATTDSTGASSNTKTILKTLGGVVESHFFDNRIVTTFGMRADRQYLKFGATPVLLNPDGKTFNFDSLNGWSANDYLYNRGPTKQVGVVARPFRGWAMIDRMTEGDGVRHFLGDLLRGLSLTYNKSSSFKPVTQKYDLYLERLPNPHGEGTDYGFALNLFDDRLVLRVNRYKNGELGSQTGTSAGIAQRSLRTDMASLGGTGFPYVLHDQAYAWVSEAHPEWTEKQRQDEVGRQLDMPWDRQMQYAQAFDAGVISATNDIQAKGTEIEVYFNATDYWTVAASGTDTQSMNVNVGKGLGQYLAERLAIWTTIKDPRINPALEPGQLWWTHNYGGSQTAAQTYALNIEAPYKLLTQQEGTARPEIRRYAAKVSTNFRLSGVSEHRILKNLNVGGALRWEDKAAIGYHGVQKLPATITDLDRNRPIYDHDRFYADAFVGYRMRMWSDRLGAKFQLNVRNIQEGGRLQAIAAQPDGNPSVYRIVDPRQFILTATFDL